MATVRRFFILQTLVLTAICGGGAARIAPPAVNLIHTPGGGIQPQVVEQNGTLHLLYFSGEPEHGDLLYVRSLDYGQTFSAPIKVNSSPGSAIAIGNIRGAQLAIGRNGRVHVAWNGSNEAKPRSATDQSPMLYARINDAGTAFEPERNLISSAWGIDGGGSLAADPKGNVYVFWHAPLVGQKGEPNRRVWVSKSTDDGKTFSREAVAFDQPFGTCGCCGMRAFAGDDGIVHVLFRSAAETVHRDMYLLTSKDLGRTFAGEKVSEWNIGACVMSSEAFLQTMDGTLAAWETQKQVYFGRVTASGTPGRDGVPAPIGAPGTGENRKYPALGTNSRGETLLVWTENMAWKKGGSVAWQVYDRDTKPEGPTGKAEGVPVWGLVAAYGKPDGSFGVIY